MNTVEGPGQALLATRQQMKVTTREVGDALNLPVTTIESIEADDYDGLPSPVFARGYVRAYAKLLELDPDPLVAMYPVDEISPQMSSGLSSGLSLAGDGDRWQELSQFMHIHRRRLLPLAAAIVGMLLILLIIGLWPEPQAPQAQIEPVVLDTAGQSLGSTVSGGAPVDSIVTQGAPVHDKPTATGELTADSEAVRRIGDGDDRLLFHFSDECWVEVKSTTGQVLYSNLGRAAQTLELVGRAPFSVLLGYAPGVTMAFNGEEVALAPHTRNNVATLVLGQ